MRITRIVLSGHLQRRMAFDPDPELESGRDEGGVWFWERNEDDLMIRKVIPWTSIAWIEEE